MKISLGIPPCNIGRPAAEGCVCEGKGRHDKEHAKLMQRDSVHPEQSTRNLYHTSAKLLLPLPPPVPVPEPEPEPVPAAAPLVPEGDEREEEWEQEALATALAEVEAADMAEELEGRMLDF